MAYTYYTGCILGRVNTGLVPGLGYRLYENNVLLQGHTSGGVQETALSGTYTVVGGVEIPDDTAVDIHWYATSESTTPLAIELGVQDPEADSHVGTYTATITVVSSSSSLPISQALVTLTTTAGSTVDQARTDSDGQVRFQLEAGSYLLSISHAYRHSSVADQTFTVTGDVSATVPLTPFTPGPGNPLPPSTSPTFP